MSQKTRSEKTTDKIWCCIMKRFKKISHVYISYCHIVYLSLEKSGIVFVVSYFSRYDFERKRTCRSIFIIFLMSGRLIAHKATQKVVSHLKFTNEVITTKLIKNKSYSAGGCQILWHCIIWIQLPSWKHNLLEGTPFAGVRFFWDMRHFPTYQMDILCKFKMMSISSNICKIYHYLHCC